MSVLAQLEPLQDIGNRRSAVRRTLKLGTVISECGTAVVIHDLSTTGLLIEAAVNLIEGESLQVEIPEAGTTIATVMWASGEYFGCQFNQAISTAAVSAALLRNPIAPEARFEAPELPFADYADGRAETGYGDAVSMSEDAVAADDDDGLSFEQQLRVILVLSLVVWAALVLALWLI